MTDDLTDPDLIGVPAADGMPYSREEPRMTTDRHPLQDANHALFAGAILGLAMKHGITLVPVADSEGNYTAMMELRLPDQPKVHLTVIVPPPPFGWQITDMAPVD